MDYEDFFSILGGATIGIIIVILLFIIAIAIFQIIATWKLYKKLGKPGWAAIVPFYAIWVIVEGAGLNWWWFLIASATSIAQLLGITELIGIAGLATIFANIVINYNIAKKFRKETGFVVLLTLLPIVGRAILAFSKDCVVDSSVVVGKNGFFGSNQSNNTNNNYNSNYNYNNNYNQTSMQQPYVAPVANPTYSEPVNQETTNNIETTEANTNAPEANDVSNETVFCTNCGTKMDKNTRFCPNCGKQNN